MCSDLDLAHFTHHGIPPTGGHDGVCQTSDMGETAAAITGSGMTAVDSAADGLGDHFG